ncbi:phage tail protein [Methanosarcinales archaeon ex4572_44]|nr:MAG: phage tail protein [Methanosarcinales archaeon ex4572_44]RLG27433.1 MAG: phage tail sheath family protein [Methanosarcinales archaeon]
MPEYLSPGVYVEEIEIGAKPIEGVSTSTVGFIGMAEKGDPNKAILITNWGQFVEKFGRYTDGAPHLAPAVYGFFANGGSRCYVIRVPDDAEDGDYVGTDEGPGKRTGLQIFNEIDEINIVCIPGVTSQTVQSATITHCEGMKDRFCILDPEEEADMPAVQAQMNNVISAKGYAALYYPWIKVGVETEENDKIKITQKFVAPSGYLAGIYARSDTERGVHKAPANEIIRGALDIKLPITKGEQDILNPKGINCIRAFPGRGIRVWGARTTATTSDPLWKYINVRRLFLFIEESIEEGTQWVVFEPNNEKLWARVRQTITQFLTRVWKDGALMGTTPEEAFFVKCDRTTMTQDDIDNGRLIVLIGVAPVKPAEFVIFRIAQWAGGSEVSE